MLYWRDICVKYAQGQYHFSTGKRPGAKKWKRALEKIKCLSPAEPHKGSVWEKPSVLLWVPQGERIGVEYLLAQTNRGDLLAPSQVPEVPSQVPEEEEEEPDDTISTPDIVGQSAAIGAGDPPSAVMGDAEPGPLVTEMLLLFLRLLNHKLLQRAFQVPSQGNLPGG
ncbi:uncharacterized protein PAE49_012125 isoform 2-T2 [Odontesthes bonariensis]